MGKNEFPGWKNNTINWLRQVKNHVGEDLTESDIEEIYAEHFDGNNQLM